MSGLLSGILPAVYSASNKLQRNVNGLLDNPKNYLAGLLMDANTRAGGLLDATNAATQESSANMTAGRGLFGGPSNNKLAGMLADAYGPGGLTVWHGSPHKFARFDASKIGTGEGAQAYGHGLYLAESPEVAGAYKKNLSKDTFVSPNGSVINRAKLADFGFDKSDIDVMLGAIQRHNGDFAAAADAMASHRPTAAKFLKGIGQQGAINEGSLYKVDLPDNAIARMLDWDVPLSNQPPAVRDALSSAGVVNLDAPFVSGLRGSELYKRARNGAPVKLPLRQIDDEIFAAQRLREAGIPGIRYLDGGSRGTGAGTSNFVIFPGEEGLLQILERNGVPIR